MSELNFQTGLTLAVLAIQMYNAYSHAQLQASLAELKVYMHQNFVAKVHK